MVLIHALLITLALLGAKPGSVTTVASDFDQYPAGAVFKGERARLRLRDAQSRRFASALADAADGEIDFDGHYVLAEIGCGSGCVHVAAIDVMTGLIFWFPDSVSNWSKAHSEPIEYSSQSRLLVIHGQLAERGSKGPHLFAFDGLKFLPVETQGQSSGKDSAFARP